MPTNPKKSADYCLRSVGLSSCYAQSLLNLYYLSKLIPNLKYFVIALLYAELS